ncbi:MAG: phosphate ABC transporter substrate-binding protein [Rhodocyclales bacterium]|nr:phosphate ABC transporter substrate-binding protein [Rhodocyclales bacterium]
MRSRCFVAGLAIAILALAGCMRADAGEAPGQSGGRLLITGSSTMAPLVEAIAKRFQSLHPGAGIEVRMGGSGRGIQDARQGVADIGMVSRALGEELRDLYGIPIARDGVAVVVHRDNPVKSLTVRQIADIFSGRTANWKQAGGRDAPVLVAKAEETRSSTELFARFFDLRYDRIQAQQVVGDNPARIRLLVENPNAILYMSVGEAERNAQSGVPLRLLPMGGVAASSKSIRSGDYPISRPLTLVTRAMPAGLAKQFIDYALSAEVTDLIVAHDFVPYLD